MLSPGSETQERRITVAEAEADYFATVKIGWLDDKDRREQLRKPMGYGNEKWEELKALIQPEDELWEVCSDQQSWEMLMGWHYLELRRNGESIASIVLAMN